jgi:acetyl-CoA carboxylase biotin carboxylase subunit
MTNKVLIANRGEIAVRIIRACKELGFPCVAVYSDVDQDSLHVRLADEAICIGGVNSYLHMNNIISAAIATGCNAIHPGYGFLAENSKFASLVEQCHLIFIGPSSQVIELLGNKINAKVIAKKCGIPIITDSEGSVDSIEEADTLY